MPTINARSLPRTAHWLEVCRSYMCDTGQTIKIAELGGDGQDSSFEQAFSNLAHAYLRDKAPSLLDHELGFQLLDRNQENTKAVGVFAFKVGSQTLIAPVFFLSGDLKGHELLYLKDQDMFVPMKENWINYILNRKPNILGAGVSRQTSQMGVMQPDLNRLSQSPYKYASAVIPPVRDFLPCYANLTSGRLKESLHEYHEHCSTKLDLSHFMKMASLPMLDVMVRLFQQRPKIAATFDKLYGLHTLTDAVKEAGARMRADSILDNPFAPVNRNRPLWSGSLLDKQAADNDKGPKQENKVEIITWDQSRTGPPPADLTEEEAEKLLSENILIKDHRDGDEVSVPYKTEVEQRLTNPHETGIYMVLTKPGDFEKCLVVVDPHGPDGRKHHCVVVRLEEGTRDWCNRPREEVWVAGQVEEVIPGGEESWQAWYEDLPEATSFEKGDGRYMLVGPRRNATCPFKVKEVLGGTDGKKSYEVDMAYDCHYGRHLSKGLHRFHDTANYEDFDEYSPWDDGQRIHLDSKSGTDLRSNHGDVFIPKGYKYLSLEPTKGDKEAKKNKDNVPQAWGPDYDKGSDNPPIRPGNIIDAELSIMRKTAALKIAHDGFSYSVNGSRGLREVEALVHLVRDHGFRQDVGQHMLKEAKVQKIRSGGSFKCRVKYANPFLTAGGGPNAPAIPEPGMGGDNPMGFPGQVQSQYQEDMPIPDMSAANTDPNVYNVNPANMPEPMDANAVGQAAASGQKEVFDTAMIGAMLKAVRDDTMIDRYIPDLVKGMDRLGRILFMFYWHQDSFAERYGKQDLPELEDALRNAFEMSGDTILFLKQKTIEPYPEEGVRDLDLGDAGGI